jgi:hypothetical protein
MQVKKSGNFLEANVLIYCFIFKLAKKKLSVITQIGHNIDQLKELFSLKM